MSTNKNIVTSTYVILILAQLILASNAQNIRKDENPWVKLSYGDAVLSVTSSTQKPYQSPIIGVNAKTTSKPSLVQLSYADSLLKTSTSKPINGASISAVTTKTISYADISKSGTITPPKPNSALPARPAINLQPSQVNNPPVKISYADISKSVTTTKPIQTNFGANAQPSFSTSNPQLNNDEEIRTFSDNLLKRDDNNAAKLVQLNLQSKTTSFNTKDLSPQQLLDINPKAFNISTISKLLLLHNNYEIESNVNEHVTGQERIEENELVDSILNTPVMQQTRNFLVSKGKLSKDPKEFRELLKLIWFNMYSRGEGKIGSSGFEHVFLAEIKKGQISGLHNWLYFNLAEKAGKANYLGYLKKIDLGDKGAILKYHFTLNNIDKPVGSMFVGTSPELEMSLYTLCFILRPDLPCPLRMGGQNFIIRTYTYRYRSKNMIGSAFPEI